MLIVILNINFNLESTRETNYWLTNINNISDLLDFKTMKTIFGIRNHMQTNGAKL